MKLIIDISEEAKRHIDTFKGKFLCGDGCDMISAIQNGTPLPKGHGDLIDRNELLDCSYEIDSMYCEYDEVVNVDDIKDAPTIIEADKESEDKE